MIFTSAFSQGTIHKEGLWTVHETSTHFFLTICTHTSSFTADVVTGIEFRIKVELDTNTCCGQVLVDTYDPVEERELVNPGREKRIELLLATVKLVLFIALVELALVVINPVLEKVELAVVVVGVVELATVVGVLAFTVKIELFTYCI